MYGDFLDKDGRYARCDEFLEVVRRLWAGETVDFDGEHIASTARRSPRSPTQCRRSTSAAPRRPPAGWPLGTRTSTSPGASRRKRSRKRSPGSGGSLRRSGARTRDRSDSVSGCTRSPATRRLLHGRRRTGCSPRSPTTRSSGSRTACAAASPRVSGGCWHCTAGARTTSRSIPTSGPASAWSAAAPGPRWSAATRRSRTGSRSTPRSGSTSSCCRRTRTSRARTGSARACCPILAERGLWKDPRPQRHHNVAVPFATAGRAAS